MGEAGDIWGRESKDKGRGLARQERPGMLEELKYVQGGRTDSKGRSGERGC